MIEDKFKTLSIWVLLQPLTLDTFKRFNPHQPAIKLANGATDYEVEKIFGQRSIPRQKW